jgi:ankyrin repeat protein
LPSTLSQREPIPIIRFVFLSFFIDFFTKRAPFVVLCLICPSLPPLSLDTRQNKQGQTPGHFAIAYKFFDLATWLFENGGDDTLPNKAGLTAYDGLGGGDDDDDD